MKPCEKSGGVASFSFFLSFFLAVLFMTSVYLLIVGVGVIADLYHTQ